MIAEHRLNLEEAERAMAAVFQEAARDGKAMAVAVTDNHGDLIACKRMDGAPARVLRHAIRKAYTAAIMGRDTSTFREDLVARRGNLEQWGDAELTTLAGGAVVRVAGDVAGAVGVGGNVTQRDDAIAHLAVEALGL